MFVNENLHPQTHVSSENKTDGKLGSWNVNKYIPSSHGDLEDKLKIAAIVGLSIFLLSIIFWAVGASVGSPGLEIIGKIFFGLSIATISIALIAIFAAGGYLCFKCS